jgi:hypothetical protein
MSSSMFPRPLPCVHVLVHLHIQVLIHVHVFFMFMFICMSISMYSILHVNVHVREENGTHEKWQLPIVVANRKRKRQTSVVCYKLKRKTEFPYFGRPTINGNRRLLFQQTWTAMLKY